MLSAEHKALKALQSLSFLLNTQEHRGSAPVTLVCILHAVSKPSGFSQPRTSMSGEKHQTFVRRCIHRAAIVVASWDQNDNVDDCLPTVVSCSCGTHPAPLQWALVSQQPDHKSVTFLTDSRIRPNHQVKKGKCDSNSGLKFPECVMAVSSRYYPAPPPPALITACCNKGRVWFIFKSGSNQHAAGVCQ